MTYSRNNDFWPPPQKKWRGAPPLPAPDKRPSQPLQLGVACRQVCCTACVKNNKPVREEHGCCCKWRETRLETTPAHFKLATTVSVSLPPFVRQPCGRLPCGDGVQPGRCDSAAHSVGRLKFIRTFNVSTTRLATLTACHSNVHLTTADSRDLATQQRSVLES